MIHYGADSSRVHFHGNRLEVHLSVPILQGSPTHEWMRSPRFRGEIQGPWHFLKDERTLIGAACMELESTPEATANKLYDGLLQALGTYHLLRIWNYVPQINKIGNSGMENYRSFCMGRSHQFTRHHLPMCSASAVGVSGSAIVIYFLATREPVRHFENPDQVPAYQYPTRYGPRSPSFSRASAVERDGKSAIYISGTASIKGHESLHIGNLDLQLATTLDNIAIMKDRTGANSTGGNPLLDQSCIYLRDARNLQTFQSLLGKHRIEDPDLRILHADICRADLLVEIETQQPL